MVGGEILGYFRSVVPCSCSLKINTPGASTAVRNGGSCFDEHTVPEVHRGVRASLSKKCSSARGGSEVVSELLENLGTDFYFLFDKN